VTAPPFRRFNVVCSDRGQHGRCVLVGILVSPAGEIVFDVPTMKWSKRAHVTVPRASGAVPVGDVLDAPVWEFWCPKCRRTPRIPKRVLVEAARQGMPEFDVSRTGN
jgi:hypothetical protein